MTQNFKKRKLLNGTEVNELERAIRLHVYTKCPHKYKLIDMETGEQYIGTMPNENEYFWKKIDEKDN